MELPKQPPKRRKVLHIITGLHTGGAEMNLLRMLPAFEQHHDNVVCCLTGRGPVSDLLEAHNISLVHLDAKKRIADFLDPSLIKKFHRLIRKEKPDVIVTYLIHADLFGRFWGKIFGVRRIFCWNRGSLLQWQWLSFFDRLTSFLVDGYIFQTRAMRDEIAQHQHISFSKTAVIPNCVDLCTVHQDVNRVSFLSALGISNPSLPTLICVANLRKGKGHAVLLRAFEQVVQKTGPANLLIVGEGEQRPILETLAKSQKSSSQIFFLGHRIDVSTLLAVSDIFVLPTFYEGMSNAILEAMQAERAIVTTDIPVNQDIITHGVSGILVPTRDDRALAEALINLITDPIKRRMLAQNGRSFVEKICSPDEIARTLSNLIISQV